MIGQNRETQLNLKEMSDKVSNQNYAAKTFKGQQQEILILEFSA